MSKSESQSVQLTYIPAEYWSELEENVHYEIITKGANPPPKSSRFFIFWIYNNTDIDMLEQSITDLFKDIPINKLTTCKECIKESF